MCPTSLFPYQYVITILTETINSLLDLIVLKKKGGGDRGREKYLSVLDWVSSHYFLSSQESFL